MVAKAEAEFGDVDVLVANAAYSERCPWHEITVEQWDRTMAVNVRGSFLCSRAVYPGMLRKGRGSIITVTSVTVDLGMAGFLDYVSSKAGILGLTRALAREVGRDGIRVNSVMPGAIRTEQEIELNFDERELAALSAERQSIPRRGYADDLTGTFIYLASRRQRVRHRTGRHRRRRLDPPLSPFRGSSFVHALAVAHSIRSSYDRPHRARTRLRR